MPRRPIAVLAALLALAPITAAGAADWPHLRGPAYDGHAALSAEDPGLELGWRISLGSGYSGIAAGSDRAVTLFSQGDSDWVAAFDLADGGEIWRQRLGSIHRGRDGSADGPLSSPAIAGETVFALGPKGRLVALALADGAVRWSRTMQTDFGAREPDYGFGATPLIVGGNLVLPAGGEEAAIVALDLETGETVWSVGGGDVEYQIPVALTLGGREQIVTGVGKTMIGIDPAGGGVLWTYELGEEDTPGSIAMAAGENRFLLSVSGSVAVFEATADAAGMSVKELYRSRELGQSYSIPVYHEGHLYGFRGQILACVDAETGERVWRSRPPGGRGLILLGDYLAIFGSEGHIVLADASPEGYRERSRIQALGKSGYTWPSYAGERILVRNLEEMAAVSIGGAGVSAIAQRGEVSGTFGEFLARLEEADDKQPLIDEFMSAQENLPLIDGGEAHFIYVGEADDLAIAGSMTDTGNPEAMQRVVGTDLFHRTFALEQGGRWNYMFIRDFSEFLVDPRNPRTVPRRQGDGEMSEFSLPGYEAPTHLVERPDGLRGDVEQHTFKSEIEGMDRGVSVYLPIGYYESENTYPLLIVHDGAAWLEKGLMNRSLDNLIGRSTQPVVVAFLEAQDEWWLEAGGTGTDAHVEMLVEELVPWLESRYRLEKGPASRGLMGNTGWGLTSVYAALKHPDVFGKVAIQSPMLGLGFEDPTMKLIEQHSSSSLAVYLDWSRYEVQNLDAGIDLSVDSRRLAEALRSGGYEFAGGEVMDSAGWGGWRSRTDDILETLYPLR